jgi:hypothetical protein
MPEITPPPIDDSEALLAAIRTNAETAHVLAAIASGGDPNELIATLLQPEAEPSASPEPQPEPEAEPEKRPLYSTPAGNQPEAPSFPSFLSAIPRSFWDT